jgi:hypothetical protein
MDIKDAYTKIFLETAGLDISDDEIKKKRYEWWWNVRGKNDGGQRLTDRAIEFIQTVAEIKTYKISFPKDFEFTPQVLLWLDQYIDSPYYFNKKYIIVLKERAAIELMLFSGDVRKLGHNKALAKRTAQIHPA